MAAPRDPAGVWPALVPCGVGCAVGRRARLPPGAAAPTSCPLPWPRAGGCRPCHHEWSGGLVFTRCQRFEAPLRVPLQATARGEAAAPGLAPHGYRLPPRVREAAWAPCCVGRLCPLNTHEPKASGPGRDARGAGSFWGDELRWAWKWWPSVVAPRAVRSGRVTCAVSVPCRMDGVTGLQGPCLPVSALRGAPLSLPGQGSPGTSPPPAGPLASQPSCVRSVRALVPPGPQLQT